METELVQCQVSGRWVVVVQAGIYSSEASANGIDQDTGEGSFGAATGAKFVIRDGKIDCQCCAFDRLRRERRSVSLALLPTNSRGEQTGCFTGYTVIVRKCVMLYCDSVNNRKARYWPYR